MGSSMFLRQTLLVLSFLSVISAMGLILNGGPGGPKKKIHGDWPEDFPLWPAGFQMGCNCSGPAEQTSAPTTKPPTTQAPTTRAPTTQAPTTVPVTSPKPQARSPQKDLPVGEDGWIRKPKTPAPPKPVQNKNKPKNNDVDEKDNGKTNGKKGGLEGISGPHNRPQPKVNVPTEKKVKQKDELPQPDVVIRSPKDPTAPKPVGNEHGKFKIESPYDPADPLAPVDGSLDFNIADPRKPQGPRKVIDPDA